MRVVVWSAAALALLTLAGALRTTQVEGSSRSARRLPPLSSASDTRIDRSDTVENEPTFRPRNSRRRDDTPSQENTRLESPRQEIRSRTRHRPQQRTETETEKTQAAGQNERHESRRTGSRTRSRPVESEVKEPISNRENVRSRSRPSYRRTTSTTLAPATVEATSPKIDEIKIEVIATNMDETSSVTAKVETTPQVAVAPTQFRRRGPVPTVGRENTFSRRQGRVAQTNISPLDLSVSGTMESLSISAKEPTTARTANDIRSSKKLRFKSRLSETDTNLTGEGITVSKKVTQSSQHKENTNASQPETQTTVPIAVESTRSSSTRTPKKPTKTMKVVRRPITRGKGSFRPSVEVQKKKHSDEIGEDDNYPASFKALIQAKNASTQPSSPPSESLSVKESQNIYSTFTSPAQTIHTGSIKNKYSRLRTNLKPEEEPTHATSEDIVPADTTRVPENPKPLETPIVPEKPLHRSREYKPRGKYNPRTRKSYSNSSSISDNAQSRNTERPQYKFSRKLKFSTQSPSSTESSSESNKKLESGNILKKSLVRPSYLSRRKSVKHELSSSETPLSVKENSENEAPVPAVRKPVLTRTSYYSRLRKNKKEISSTTESIETSSDAEIIQTPADKKFETPLDSPLIFSLLKRNEENVTKHTEKLKDVFIIAVSSMESQENNATNPVTSEPSYQPTTNNNLFNTRYFANTDQSSITSSKPNDTTVIVTPASRNIVTRKYGRKPLKRTKSKEENDQNPGTSPKPRERHFKKFSDTVSKSTEPSTNGIPEHEKLKNRYSSKYRGSHLDKTFFYKPTVPTITPSTAWLKFFVTDPQLAKSVEEPKWFDGEDIYVARVTTQLPRSFTAPPTITYESSLELVEGEEFQIGDMNAISITQTRSTLSSADLVLSESLTKPQHTMNVEASQHSSSVTISIFDALADILTSTPRIPRLSTTTEITTTQQNSVDIKQTELFNGVSSNINVNTVIGLTSQPFTTVDDVNTNTKSVQITDQPLNVINSISARAGELPLNNQDGSTPVVNTPVTTFPPTTPLSARKPFAIKFLYSETETPMSTATSSTNQPSTDIQTTVHDTVSNVLLTNNNLVSPELTSMLSNNIRDIINSMDLETRSKISEVEMQKILSSLVPKAIAGPLTENGDVDNTPETTPYSLEAIRDTENIDITNGVVSLQDVMEKDIVNNSSTTVAPIPTIQVVNSTVPVGSTSRTVFETSNQMTLAGSTMTTSTFDTQTNISVTTPISATVETTVTSSIATASDKVIVNSDQNLDDSRKVTNTENLNVPLPFFTNAKVVDLDSSDDDNLDNNIQATRYNPVTLTTQAITPSQDTRINGDDDIPYPGMVSPLQYWVLSKKARVLKMIEDLIRQHNNEIATAPPLTELLEQPNNIPLSHRLTEILNTMTSTTESSVNSPTSPMTTLSPPPFPLVTQPIEFDTRDGFDNGPTTTLTTTEATFTSSGVKITNTPDPSEISFRIESSGTTTSETQSSSDTSSEVNTTPASITAQLTTEDFAKMQDASTTNLETEQRNTETTTESVSTETTQISIETTTVNTEETTTLQDTESTTKSTTIASQSDASTVGNQLYLPSQPPKKDYVIFGILPNNTVVRKDPNEDILETLTEASPYIIYSVLPNNTIIRRFPNGTRVPRVMQKIDVLPISPWSLRNPYSPIHNNPAIVRPRSNQIRVSTNIVTSADSSNNGTENLTNNTVNNQQIMIHSSALNIKDSSSFGVTTTTYRPPADKSTASHVLSLRTSTMLPSIDEILLNSISSAVKEEMLISSMMSSTHEPAILTLDIDPETKQIRTEKPGEGNDSPVFKFIPIDEVMVQTPEDTNVQRLQTKMPTTLASPDTTVTESNTQTPQIQTRIENTDDPTTTAIVTVGTPNDNQQTTSTMTDQSTMTSILTTTEPPTTTPVVTTTQVPTTTQAPTTTTTTQAPTTTQIPTTTTTQTPTTTQASTTTTTQAPAITETPTTIQVPTTTQVPTTSPAETSTPEVVTATSVEEDYRFLQNLLQSTERSAKSLNGFISANQIPLEVTTQKTEETRVSSGYQNTFSSSSSQSQQVKILQAVLAANTEETSKISIPNLEENIKAATGTPTTTSRSIEDDIKQFEEDTKLLKALIAATGQNPSSFNIPSLANLNIPTNPRTTTFRPTLPPSTTARVQTTTISDSQILADAKLIQELLQATGPKTDSTNVPIISGVTSNVRIASNPQTTSVGSDPTIPTIPVRPIYTSRTIAPQIITSTEPRTVSTFQPSTTTEEVRLSTLPQRRPTTTPRLPMMTARRAPSRFTASTEMPSTSTFSDQEDLQFLQNLKSVLKTNTETEDPEAALANRIIALAVDRSLNEIQSGTDAKSGRTGIPSVPTTRIYKTTTTNTQRPTTTAPTTTVNDNTPSIEDDIKQFQEDTKLLQALLKATGQDPSKLNLPTLPPNVLSTNVSPKIPLRAEADLNLLSNLLASPSPLNEPFDSLTPKTNRPSTANAISTPRPFGAKILVKDDIKNEQDEHALLKTLVKLQDAQQTTTKRSKIAITGQSPDEVLQKLQKLAQTNPPRMMSDSSTKAPAVSTEFGKSNDALLAALLKEQGFGPTTVSSVDEQIRLAALLNQVVVTPKARRTTTTPPPPPQTQRRPILDGLAWLWQQWRETGAGPNVRPSRGPSASPGPSISSSTSNRVSWFGSGPFVGNAEESTGNRIPLEPPRAVSQTPGRGQLVTAAINVSRAFSQFLGAAIQGAAQTVQSVIRAGQRARAEVYNEGSG